MKRRFTPSVRATTGGPALFKGWKEWSQGNYVIGEFLSSFETTYRGQTSTNFRIKVLECDFTCTTKEGEEVDPTDKTLVLNAAGQLNKFMQDVKPKMLVEVVYGGKQPGSDGALYHTFERLEAGYATEENDSQEEDNGL